MSQSITPRPRLGGPSLALCSLVLGACSSSSTTSTTTVIVPGGSSTSAASAASNASGASFSVSSASSGATTGSSGTTTTGGSSGAGGTTTIAAARQSMPTGAITVKGFVTALAGVPGDYPQWYIEDPAGGEYSGIDVYCDPDVTKACKVPEPALNDLIEVTGTLTTYMGQVELEPTAMTVLQSNATPPPIPMLTAAQIAPSGDSPYRGVFVSLIITPPTKLVVDSVTPKALADTACTAPVDGGVATCSPACQPPYYSGFQANDGAGNEVYIEAPFFNTDPLQSSPECLTQSGVVPVKVGTTFSAMSGILDIDPYSSSQALSPVVPSDYTMP